MSSWGWQPQRTQGIWRHGAAWLRPFVAAAPYLTIVMLLLTFYFLGGTLTAERGILVNLQQGSRLDGAATDLVVLVLPVRNETLVFFDDTRYLLGDAASMTSFREQLAERVRRSGDKPLLVLADRQIRSGELVKLTDEARQCGVARVLLAEKSAETVE